MDYQEYHAAANLANAHYESGNAAEALRLFERLIADHELPDLDRSSMASNVAVVLTAQGAPESEIQAAYDRGIELERRWLRGAVIQRKAAWLVTVGRSWEARDLLVRLRCEAWLNMYERDSIDRLLESLD